MAIEECEVSMQSGEAGVEGLQQSENPDVGTMRANGSRSNRETNNAGKSREVERDNGWESEAIGTLGACSGPSFLLHHRFTVIEGPVPLA